MAFMPSRPGTGGGFGELLAERTAVSPRIARTRLSTPMPAGVLHRPQPPSDGRSVRGRPLSRARWPSRRPTWRPLSVWMTAGAPGRWPGRAPGGRRNPGSDRPPRLDPPGGRGGTTAVVVCPVGFVADHLEILYDLDIEAAGWPPRSEWPSPARRPSMTTRALSRCSPRSCRRADGRCHAGDGPSAADSRRPAGAVAGPDGDRPIAVVGRGGIAGLAAAWEACRPDRSAGRRPSPKCRCSRRTTARWAAGRPSSPARRWTWPPTPSLPAAPRPSTCAKRSGWPTADPGRDDRRLHLGPRPPAAHAGRTQPRCSHPLVAPGPVRHPLADRVAAVANGPRPSPPRPPRADHRRPRRWARSWGAARPPGGRPAGRPPCRRHPRRPCRRPQRRRPLPCADRRRPPTRAASCTGSGGPSHPPDPATPVSSGRWPRAPPAWPTSWPRALAERGVQHPRRFTVDAIDGSARDGPRPAARPLAARP